MTNLTKCIETIIALKGCSETTIINVISYCAQEDIIAISEIVGVYEKKIKEESISSPLLFNNLIMKV